MMRFLFLCLFLLFSVRSFCSITIYGRVTEVKTGRPVDLAYVFLASTTYGTLTNANGEFALQVSRPGVYKFSVTHLSFVTSTKEITVGNVNISQYDVTLSEKARELDAVKVTFSDPDRESNLELFVSTFLGHSRNSERCKILNPGAISFYKNKSKGYIKAYADSMIVIENKALGYLIRYKLDGFYIDAKGAFFTGLPLFEDQLSSVRAKRKVLSRRREAYDGSIQHFIRSLYVDSLQNAGFKVLKLEEREMDKKEAFTILSNPLLVSRNGLFLHQTLMADSLNCHFGDDSLGRKVLQYNKPFKVVYTKQGEEKTYGLDPMYWGITRSRNEQASVLKVCNANGLVLFGNGAYPASDLIVAGYMGWKTFADKLPLNYEAEAKTEE